MTGGGGDRAGGWPARWLALSALVFAVVATLNSGGYRYGVGDQAFYLPAVQRHLEPASFPHDRPVIDDQDRLSVFPSGAAAVVRATGMSRPALFGLVYLASLFGLFLAARSLAAALGFSAWAQAALLAALTIKHRVGLTGVNTLEGYAHPRELAFALGVGAVSCVLRRKPAAALGLVASAFAVHPTTALWFGVWVGVALVAAEPRLRAWLVPAAAAAAGASAWAVVWGPLGGQTVRMDGVWLGVLTVKDYLLPTGWPAAGWGVALAYVAAVAGGFALRRSAGLACPREGALVAGLAALLAVFVASLPLVHARVALAVQSQVSRVFWMFDLVATAYAVWAAVDGRRAASFGPGKLAAPRRAIAAALLLVTAAAARGAWVMWVEHPGRSLVRIGLPHDDWQDAMAWLSRTPLDTHVLADPGHAWRYGTSVRVAAGRDVLLEEVKDSAMALYSRRVAARVAERIGALGDFGSLSPEGARALAAHYDLDYLVTDHRLDLPMVYRNARFTIYRLGPPVAPPR
ncbi:MAG TPA: hypothetical protein PKH99_12770 [Vicinamibacterales bacterium]|nr:hypothetical protein [Vicinamibacterales bacterium]